MQNRVLEVSGVFGRRRYRIPMAHPVPPPPPPSLRAVDTHSHIHLTKEDGVPERQPDWSYDDPRAWNMQADAVVAEAEQAGLVWLATVSTDMPSARVVVDQSRRHANVYGVIGIHPNDSDGTDDAAVNELHDLALDPNIVAIGETGLDWYRMGASKETQEESFRRHISLARETDTALVIHDRDAHEDIVRILCDQPSLPKAVIFHCFSGDEHLAEICNTHGWYMSFAGNVTFPSADSLRRGLLAARPELILSETDAPFMAPVPHRGQSNTPAKVIHTVNYMAMVRETDPVAFGEQLILNANCAMDIHG